MLHKKEAKNILLNHLIFLGVSLKVPRVNRYQLVLCPAHIHIKYLSSHLQVYQNMIQIFHYAKQVIEIKLIHLVRKNVDAW